MDQSLYFVLGWGAPLASALFALFLIRSINRQAPGTERMQRIAALIRAGAMAFLRTEYTVLAGFVAVMFVVLWLFLPGNSLLTAVSFLVGRAAVGLGRLDRHADRDGGGGADHPRGHREPVARAARGVLERRGDGG